MTEDTAQVLTARRRALAVWRRAIVDTDAECRILSRSSEQELRVKRTQEAEIQAGRAYLAALDRAAEGEST